MTRYHPLLVALHWLLAVLIIAGLIVGGNVLAETPNDAPEKLVSLRLHMGAGIAILVLMLVRFGIRLMARTPPHADIGHPVLNRAGVWAHWAFYPVVLAMAGSGLYLANIAGLPAIVFGGSGDPLPADFDVFTARGVHGALASVLGLLIVAHVAAGLFHQFIRRDALFARMWFGRRDVD